MSRGRSFLWASGAFVAALSGGVGDARAEAPIGVTWADCVVSPQKDADRDGLDDACEYAVVKGFEPELVFGKYETATSRVPFWAARPDGGSGIRIFYALGYLIDAGDPDYFGVSGHVGDSEYIVLRVGYDGGGAWSLHEAYLSAHYGTACDAGDWFPATDFAFPDKPGGRPRVYVAEGKHANYTDPLRCDAGGCHQDSCSVKVSEPLGVKPERDLGVRSTPLIDKHYEFNNAEWFWTDVAFCGWQRGASDSRKGCCPAANSYALELDAAQMDWGPVAPIAALCEPCASDGDCADGGRCVDGACGRACESGGCPARSHCEEKPFGEGQCKPDTSCAALLACAGRECGDDGLGGTCGACAAGMTCGADGECVPEATTATGTGGASGATSGAGGAGGASGAGGGASAGAEEGGCAVGHAPTRAHGLAWLGAVALVLARRGIRRRG